MPLAIACHFARADDARPTGPGVGKIADVAGDLGVLLLDIGVAPALQGRAQRAADALAEPRAAHMVVIGGVGELWAGRGHAGEAGGGDGDRCYRDNQDTSRH